MPGLLSTKRRFLGGSILAWMAVTCGIFISWHGALGIPVQVSAVIAGLDLSAKDSGFLGTLELTTMSVVSILLALRIDRWSKPGIALLGVVLAIAGQALSGYAHMFGSLDSYDVLLVTRLVVGVGAGLIYGAACASVAGNPSGDRLFGLGVSAGQVFLTLMLLTMPWIASHWNDQQGVYLTLAALSIAFGGFLYKLPNPRITKEQKMAHTAQPALLSPFNIFLFFVALSLFNIAIGMDWSFADRRADDIGMTDEQAGSFLAMMPLGGILGSGIAGVIGDRFGRVRTFVVALLCCTVACFIMARSHSVASMVAAMLTLGTFELFVMTYFIATATRFDRQGHWVTFAGGMTMLTYGFGPGIGGFLSQWITTAQVCETAGITCAVAAIVQIPVCLALEKKVTESRRRQTEELAETA